MPKCNNCGLEVAEDDARFCPNCGAPLQVQVRREAKIVVISTSHRALAVAVFFAIGFLATLAGSLSTVESSEAKEIVQQVEELREFILNSPELGSAMIFGNNMIHCLTMFIPVLGLVRGLYVLYSTGRALAALGLVYNSNPLYLTVITFIFPHAVLEYLAYSIALSEGFWLTYVLVKKNLKSFRGEIVETAKMISLSSLILLSAAFIEMYTIIAQI